MPPKLGEYTNWVTNLTIEPITNEPFCHPHIGAPDIIKRHFGKTIPVTIKRIIFNPPATIAIFSDGSKSVVKARGEDKYDPEKGVAMAIAKRFLSKKDYAKMITSAGVKRVYDKLDIKGQLTVDAAKETVKLDKPAKK